MSNDNNDQAHEKKVSIVINGRSFTVPDGDITFEEVLRLAYDNNPPQGDYVFTVTFRRGHGDKPEGTMLPGGSVKVKEGMIFNVTATHRS